MLKPVEKQRVAEEIAEQLRALIGVCHASKGVQQRLQSFRILGHGGRRYFSIGTPTRLPHSVQLPS